MTSPSHPYRARLIAARYSRAMITLGSKERGQATYRCRATSTSAQLRCRQQNRSQEVADEDRGALRMTVGALQNPVAQLFEQRMELFSRSMDITDDVVRQDVPPRETASNDPRDAVARHARMSGTNASRRICSAKKQGKRFFSVRSRAAVTLTNGPRRAQQVRPTVPGALPC